jgi:hypothetical protein
MKELPRVEVREEPELEITKNNVGFLEAESPGNTQQPAVLSQNVHSYLDFCHEVLPSSRSILGGQPELTTENYDYFGSLGSGD